jgi:hypothetical protein
MQCSAYLFSNVVNVEGRPLTQMKFDGVRLVCEGKRPIFWLLRVVVVVLMEALPKQIQTLDQLAGGSPLW